MGVRKKRAWVRLQRVKHQPKLHLSNGLAATAVVCTKLARRSATGFLLTPGHLLTIPLNGSDTLNLSIHLNAGWFFLSLFLYHIQRGCTECLLCAGPCVGHCSSKVRVTSDQVLVTHWGTTDTHAGVQWDSEEEASPSWLK